MGKPHEILAYLSEKGQKSAAQIGRKFNIQPQTVERHLRDKSVKGDVKKFTTKLGTVMYDAVYVAAPPKKTAVKAAPKLDYRINDGVLINLILDCPKSQAELSTALGIPKDDVITAIKETTISGDINHLVSENGTRYCVIFSSAPPANTLDFKNGTFKKEGKSSTWNELPDSYVKSRRWASVN